jgi:hypothetical protein
MTEDGNRTRAFWMRFSMASHSSDSSINPKVFVITVNVFTIRPKTKYSSGSEKAAIREYAAAEMIQALVRCFS